MIQHGKGGNFCLDNKRMKDFGLEESTFIAEYDGLANNRLK